MGNGIEDYKGTGHLKWLQLLKSVDPTALLIKRLVGAKIAFYFKSFFYYMRFSSAQRGTGSGSTSDVAGLSVLKCW